MYICKEALLIDKVKELLVVTDTIPMMFNQILAQLVREGVVSDLHASCKELTERIVRSISTDMRNAFNRLIIQIFQVFYITLVLHNHVVKDDTGSHNPIQVR